MPQDVIEVTEREVEIIEVIEQGPAGPQGPQPDINYTVVSSSQTVTSRQLIAADTSGGSFTLTLPLNPAAGDAVDIFDYSETFDSNPLTIARNGQPIESLNEDLVCNVEGAYFTLIYTGETRGWQVVPRFGTSGGGGESTLTTQGDMLYRGVGINTRLPIGSAGQILKVNSGATAPEWGAAPATGVTSVGITGSDGIEVDSGSPVTGSGSIALGVNAATLRSHINVADGAEVNVQSNWTEANSGSDAFILNKPTLGTAAAQDSTAFAAASHTHTPSEVGLGNVSNTAQVTSVTGTAPIVSSGGTTPAISISAATTSAAGSMSGADKLKLDGIAAGAEVNVNADWNASSGDAQILNKPTLGTAAAEDTTAFAAATHASTHAAGGADELFDQNLNTTDNVMFNEVTTDNNLTVGGDLIVNNAVTIGDNGIAFTSAGATATIGYLGLGDAATADIGTGAGDVAAGDHTHTQLHDRSHAMTGTSDHTAGAHKVFYSDGSGNVQELALGATGTVLTSGGTATAPTFAAAASGGTKTYAVFTALDNQPPASNYATLDTRNSIAVLDFDDATDESAVFVGIIPEGASLGSGLKIRLHWMATTATSGNCVWDVSMERMDTDLDSDSFDTIASATAAANGTSGILTVTEITLTTIDSVTAGDGFRLKVTRDANNGSDDMSGDAELVAVEVRSAA